MAKDRIDSSAELIPDAARFSTATGELADGYRIALEFWNQATGCVRSGYQLAVHRCKRCGGFHISQRRIEKPVLNFSMPQQGLPACRDNPLNSASVITQKSPAESAWAA